VKTLSLLFQKKPKVVIVQSPRSFAVLFVYIYCALTKNQYIIDADSAAFARIWLFPEWMIRFLARRAVATIVTNEYFQQMIQGWGAYSFVLRDIPITFSRLSEAYSVNGRFNVVAINTFASDEPLNELLQAAEHLDDVQF
jgi:hypothetical protein